MSLAAGWRQCSSQSDTGLTIQIDTVLSGGVFTIARKEALAKAIHRFSYGAQADGGADEIESQKKTVPLCITSASVTVPANFRPRLLTNM